MSFGNKIELYISHFKCLSLSLNESKHRNDPPGLAIVLNCIRVAASGPACWLNFLDDLCKIEVYLESVRTLARTYSTLHFSNL